jgi:hypothetical protein
MCACKKAKSFLVIASCIARSSFRISSTVAVEAGLDDWAALRAEESVTTIRARRIAKKQRITG